MHLPYYKCSQLTLAGRHRCETVFAACPTVFVVHGNVVSAFRRSDRRLKTGRTGADNKNLPGTFGHNCLILRLGLVTNYRIKLTGTGLFKVNVCITAVQAADAGTYIRKAARFCLIRSFGVGYRLSAHGYHIRFP